MTEEINQTVLIAPLVHNTDLLRSVRSEIDPKIWRSKAQRYVVKLILALFDQNGVSPRRATLLRAVDHNVDKEDFKEEVHGVVQTVYAESVEESKGSFTEELLQKIRRLSRLSAGEKYIELVGSGKFDEADRVVEKAKTIGVGNKGYDLLDMDNISEICDPNKSAYGRKGIVPTGFTKLDNILRGGYGFPEHHVVCAPQGKGKSRFANNVYANVIKAGKSACYFTMEMDEPVVATRTWQILCGLSIEDLKTPAGRKSVEQTAAIIKKRGGVYDIKRYPENTVCFDDLEGYILRQGNQFDLIVVDYIDKMINSPGTSTKNEWKLEAEKFEEGRKFSGNVGSSLLNLMQAKNMDTDGEDGGQIIIIEKNARGAYGKFDCVDSFSSINMTEDQENKEEFTFYTGKNRYNKGSKYLSFGFEGETMRIYEK